ncbi:MAG: hypothetical protein ACYDGN_13990 [Acidimicrobiales bacterium]
MRPKVGAEVVEGARLRTLPVMIVCQLQQSAKAIKILREAEQRRLSEHADDLVLLESRRPPKHDRGRMRAPGSKKGTAAV